MDAPRFYQRLVQRWLSSHRAQGPEAEAALGFLQALAGEGSDVVLPAPFQNTVDVLHQEWRSCSSGERQKAAQELFHSLEDDDAPLQESLLWAYFFPEALYLHPDPETQISKLRQQRTVGIEGPVEQPLTDVPSQLIFTSNVLLEPPWPEFVEASGDDEAGRITREAALLKEEQAYWYDHPIPIGISTEADEVVHGLEGLAQTLAYEKRRGTCSPQSRLTVLLSVSVTHPGLRSLAKPWLSAQLARCDAQRFQDLDVYAFTEDDADALRNLLDSWLPGGVSALGPAFGVDGEYGRHYSFLKALPALWAVLENSEALGTFKIDLDQVFPQDELTAETGKSAFEHFTTALWGAKARNGDGEALDLGMIAGGLVNEKDIRAGLFTPDIPWPSGELSLEDSLFFKQRPMAVSTRAEIMTRYGEQGRPDGVNSALHRIHVTGGTNGILFQALRKHRPFTPAFVGRAEDQGYILSSMDHNHQHRQLAYLHAPGLLMRHDKEAFAAGAVHAGKAGSYVGDLVRMFVFSAYGQQLPGGQKQTKSSVDPFTGAFITPMPATMALLRLALHLLEEENQKAAQDLLELAGKRLPPWIFGASGCRPEDMQSARRVERAGWDAYYDALDRLEANLGHSPQAQQTAEEFRRLAQECKITK
ncbi:MAG: hypothetical protein MI717_12550 [Spirochaetales bacterium]|nr:hypothetical protein [Spirochaetales bacterium]